MIYLDIDGVCVDFLRGALHLHLGEDGDRMLEEWPKGMWYIEKVLGISEEEFWEPINKAGAPFWRGLKEFPEFPHMYLDLLDLDEVVFLTTPSFDPESLTGKLQWIQDRFGSHFKDYIMAPRKELLAVESAVLIDDNEDNIEKFVSAGGSGVLWPRRWNKGDESRSIQDLLKEVERHLL